MTSRADGEVEAAGRQHVGNYGAVDQSVAETSETASVASSEVQEGVKRIEAVSRVWSKWGLTFAYCSIFLMAFTTSLESQVTYSLSAFAVSSFKTHSLISTVFVVQGIVNAVIKAPMAKVADVFGRLEAFSLSVVLFMLGYIQMALSHSVQTYASAQIFYSAGATGLQILLQIFIADTSTLLNRALFSSLPDTPFLLTVWIGSIIAAAILSVASWRWGYAIWAVVLPVTFMPLALSLFLNTHKAKRVGILVRQPPSHASWRRSTRKLFFDLDVVGIVLLSAACALILLPLTLAPSAEGGWHNRTIMAMMTLGLALLILFPFWESQAKLARHPLIPLNLFRSRTFCAGCLVGFFYFMVFYLSTQPYFYSYLLVVHNQSVTAAGRITQTFSFTATVANIVISLLIQHVARFKPFLIAGSAVYLLGTFFMLHFRTQQASVPVLIFAQATLGVGAALLHVPAQLAVQTSAISHQQVGAATAVFMTLVEMGGGVGAAISGAVWGALVPNKLESYLPESARGEAAEIYASVVKACSYAWGSPERDGISRAYQETMTVLLTVAVGMCLPLMLLSWLVADVRLDGTGKGVQKPGVTEVDGEVVMSEQAAVAASELRRRGGKKWWWWWWLRRRRRRRTWWESEGRARCRRGLEGRGEDTQLLLEGD